MQLIAKRVYPIDIDPSRGIPFEAEDCAYRDRKGYLIECRSNDPSDAPSSMRMSKRQFREWLAECPEQFVTFNAGGCAIIPFRKAVKVEVNL